MLIDFGLADWNHDTPTHCRFYPKENSSSHLYNTVWISMMYLVQISWHLRRQFYWGVYRVSQESLRLLWDYFKDRIAQLCLLCRDDNGGVAGHRDPVGRREEISEENVQRNFFQTVSTKHRLSARWRPVLSCSFYCRAGRTRSDNLFCFCLSETRQDGRTADNETVFYSSAAVSRVD